MTDPNASPRSADPRTGLRGTEHPRERPAGRGPRVRSRHALRQPGRPRGRRRPRRPCERRPTMTYSILGYDASNGDLGVAVQSKFPGVGSLVPYGEAEVGVVATQAFGKPRPRFCGADAPEVRRHARTSGGRPAQRRQPEPQAAVRTRRPAAAGSLPTREPTSTTGTGGRAAAGPRLRRARERAREPRASSTRWLAPSKARAPLSPSD